VIRRGDVCWVDFGPVAGSEAAGRRPAVVVSNDEANLTATRLGRGVVTVVPVTSNVTHVFPFQVLLQPASTGLRDPSKAQAEQVRSVAVHRLVDPPLGTLTRETMAEIDKALRLHLDL
jgi:mRNA interferase MazF